MSCDLPSQARAKPLDQGLPAGTILEVLGSDGVQCSGPFGKHSIRCPFHDDAHASAFVDSERNVFYCSVCTPQGGWSARRLAAVLRQPWPLKQPRCLAEGRLKLQPRPAAFTAADACHVWSIALARARNSSFIDADGEVYAYLHRRGLADAWEEGAFGILAGDMALPTAVAGWPGTHHRLVVPLYETTGDLANIQARAIRHSTRKTLFPRGSRAKGCLFASRTGLAVLRGSWEGLRQLVLGEGLTDFLGLVITSPVPVLSAPGTGLAASSIGDWVAGSDVLLTLDDDSAGREAVAPTAAAAYHHRARSVRRVIWPGRAKDACQVIEERGVAALREFLDREMGVCQ
jgi:hypothetical protein